MQLSTIRRAAMSLVVITLVAATSACFPPPKSPKPPCPVVEPGTWFGEWREDANLAAGGVLVELTVTGKSVAGSMELRGGFAFAAGALSGSVRKCNEIVLTRTDGAVQFEGVLSVEGNRVEGRFTSNSPLPHASGSMRLSADGPGGLADIDGDGDVDCDDLDSLLADYSRVGWGLRSDLNRDGTVGIADLAVLLANYSGPPCDG